MDWIGFRLKTSNVSLNPLFAAAFAFTIAALVGCSTTLSHKGADVTAVADNNHAPDLAAAAVSEATGSALQGDAVSAMAILARVPEAAFTGDTLVFRRCMLERFDAPGPPPLAPGEDPWIVALAQAYASYWHGVLTKSVPIEAAEMSLAAAVGPLIGRPVETSAELENAEPEILAAVQAHGIHALLGRTMPLRELMLWKKQSVLEREVDLPGGRETVKVFLLDDFVVRGWGHYATCGRRSAAGWATDTALFAVRPGYKNIDDEVFSVRFLAHEAQHFADKRRFPGLGGWELEYRAKLVELSLATHSQSGTLKLFCENRAASNRAPHGYANARVVRELEEQLGIDESTLCGDGDVPTRAIQDLARKLLEEDTAARQSPPGARPHPSGQPG